MSSEKLVLLKSYDGKSFEVDEAVARQSMTITQMLEDVFCLENGVRFKITSKTLAKVLQYCQKHVEAAAMKSEAVDKELKAWDAEFMKINQPMLSNLILAAHFLQIQKLVELASKTVADMMKGKTPEQIRETFYINDLTHEEKAKIRRENPYAFD